MSRQLVLDLPARPALGREAFLVGPTNQAALAMIESWQDWSGGKLALVGAAGSGKTHLAHVWAAMSGARIVAGSEVPDASDLPEGASLVLEDIDRALPLGGAGERALFHLHNRVIETGGRLLLTGRSAPSHWKITLPDLASRLGATAVVRLELPDDTLLAGVLVKLFADRQVRVGPQVVTYLARRIGRSVADAERVVEALDRAALAEGREVRRPLAVRVLAQMGLTDG